MELLKGTTLQSGKYTIECTLGNGGFGITYKALQSSLQRKVAIKEFFMKDLCGREGNTMTILSESSSATVNSCKSKFINEARIVANLNNAYIVRIHDVFEENGTAYYVMELLERGSLKDQVERMGPLAESVALGFIEQVSEALYHIHEHGLLHLDIKPANIMLNQYNQAVLIDFGISRHFDSASEDTTATIGVSEGYSPLEQYDGSDITGLKPATDIYSLGATLFYLLTGNKPPKAATVNETGLPALPSSISEKTQKAISKAMSPKRSDRFQDVISFVRELGLNIHIPKIISDDTTTIGRPANREDISVKGNDSSGKSFTGALIGILAACLILAIGYLGLNKWQTKDKESGHPTEIREGGSGTQTNTPAQTKNEHKETVSSSAEPSATKKSVTQQSSGTIDLGYATYKGKLKNGKPDGIGTLTFKESHIVDSRDPGKHVAEPGQYIKDGLFQNGHLVQGNLYSSNGEKVAFIMIGG